MKDDQVKKYNIFIFVFSNYNFLFVKIYLRE